MMVSPITPSGYNIAKELSPKKCKIASRTVVDHPELCKEIINNNITKKYFVLSVFGMKNFAF